MSKRLFDLLFSSVGLLVLSPVMLLIALLVRLDSPGPAIFRQTRIGRYGRPFVLYKFRSMLVVADGPRITSSCDVRITSVGRILRNTKLDELPQLYNVLTGDMSLVGPRPEVREFVELYSPKQRDKILSVRPGITDDAAIRYRDENVILAEAEDPRECYINTILPEKLALYEEYVDEQSFVGDLLIIIKTIGAVVSRRKS